MTSKEVLDTRMYIRPQNKTTTTTGANTGNENRNSPHPIDPKTCKTVHKIKLQLQLVPTPEMKTGTVHIQLIQRRAKQAKEKNLFTYFIKSEICGVNKNAEFCGCCFSFRATKLQLCYFDSTFEVDAKN